MAWTAPRTWVSGESVTAAHLNAQIRDNLLHCAPHVAVGGGGYISSVSENAVAARKTHRDNALPGSTRDSTSYGDLDDGVVGPTVTLETDTTCLIIHGADAYNEAGGTSCFTSVAVTGATSIAADDDWAVRCQTNGDSRMAASNFMYFETLNPGENTFTLKYRVGVSGNEGTWLRRRLTAIPF